MPVLLALLLLVAGGPAGPPSPCGDGASLAQGKGAMMAGQPAEAAGIFDLITRQHPACGQAWTGLAWAQVRSGNERRGLELLMKRGRDPEAAAGAALARGVILRQIGQRDAAARAFAQATRHDPHLASAWTQRAGLALSELRLRTAWEMAGRALDLDPGDGEVYRVLEQWLEVSGDGNALRGLFDASLEAGNHEAVRGLGDLFFRLGVSRTRRDRPDLAIAYYRQSLRAHRLLGDASGELAILLNLGWITHTGLRDSERALAWFDMARARARETGDRVVEARAWFNIGLVHASEGLAERAEQEFLQSIATSYGNGGSLLPLRKKALKEIGDLRLGTGDLEGAADSYRSSLTMEIDRQSLQAEAETLAALAGLNRRMEAALSILPPPLPAGRHERLSSADPLVVAVARGDLVGTAKAVEADPDAAARIAARVERRRGEIVALAAGEYQRRAEALVGGVAATEVRTEHFRIRSDLAAPSGLEAVGRVMESTVEVYADLFGLDAAFLGDLPATTVYLLSRRQDYDLLTDLLFFPAASRGHYAPEHGVIVLHLERDRPESLATSAIHETVHMVNRLLLVGPGGAVPPWLDEGLAMYFGLTRLDDEAGFRLGKVNLGREKVDGTIVEREETTWLRGLREALGESQALSLRDVVDEPTRDAFLGPERHLYYAEAWTLVHFLLHGGGGAWREGFMDYLDALEASRGSVAALELSLGTDLADLEQAWRNHVVYGL